MTSSTRRVWLVTGASSGFGRAVTEAALAAGDVVVATARRPEALADLVAAHPDQVEAVVLDVTDTAAGTAVVDDVQDRHGRIDVLVNNAGRGQVGAAEETTEAELRALFDLHVFGPAALVRGGVAGHARPRRGRHRADVVVRRAGRLPGLLRVLRHEVRAGGLLRGARRRGRPTRDPGHRGRAGAFRTGFSGAGLVQSTPIPAYDDTVGPTRDMITGIDGTQPGDPARAAAAILTALGADEPPLRLPLGEDAVDGVLGHLETIAAEVRAWEHVGRATGYPQSAAG